MKNFTKLSTVDLWSCVILKDAPLLSLIIMNIIGYLIPTLNISAAARQLSIETLASVSIFDNRGVKEFLEALNDSRFVLIDRGCILNVDFAKQITGTEVILTTNERLAISRRMLKNLKLALIREWNI